MYSIRDYLTFSWQLINGYRINTEKFFAELRETDVNSHLNRNGPLKVLDLANGRLRPQSYILHAQGYRPFGIDLMNYPSKGWSDSAYSLARKIYKIRLDISNGNDDDNQNLICGDVSYLPYRNDTFDLISSVAAFEHFNQVPLVVSEMHRVTRSGGIAWILIHLFTSPSGGHNVNFMEYPLKNIPKGVDAWDHLRKRKLPIRVPLNEWRIHQYIEEFSKYFIILKNYCVVQEGEDFLTSEVLSELSNYSKEELTCRAYVIVAQKQ